MAELDSLFSTGGLNDKMNFLNENSEKNNDGIYRIDLKKVKDAKKGWTSVVRLLPNLTKEGNLGQSAIEKITHYVDIKENKDLSGWFDSPKNFNEKCPLTDLYYTMTKSKNALLEEKAKCLKYSKKYYSYCLVIEDEQQPELVGKIMILQYGKQIKDKITAEMNGEISDPCNVFDLVNGKDLKLIVKEVVDPNGTSFPSYISSGFKGNNSSLPIYKDGKFKNVPVVDGTIEDKFKPVIKEFLLDREFELESFSPKRLTEEDQSKISEISNYLTGKSSGNFNKSNTVSSDDFDFEETGTNEAMETSNSSDDDDFFSDLD